MLMVRNVGGPMTVNLKMRRILSSIGLMIPSLRQITAVVIISQFTLTAASVSASEVKSNRHRQVADDDDDIVMPNAPINHVLTVQPTAQRTPPAIVAPKPVVPAIKMEDESTGATRAQNYVTKHPLAPVPDAIDKAPLPLKPLVAVTTGIGSVVGGITDTIGDGLGLHSWDQMSLKELSRRYSQNPTVAKTMNEMETGTSIARNAGRGISGGKLSTTSTGRCYMFVQIAMGKGGLTPDAELRGISGQNARNAGEALTSKKYGFVNLLDMPQYRNQIIEPNGHLNLPMGAVLVTAVTVRVTLKCTLQPATPLITSNRTTERPA